MEMLIRESQPSDTLVVFELKGELDVDTQDTFEAAVCRELGSSSVVVDCSQLEFLAIASLRSLLLCQRSAQGTGHSLVYADVPAQARRLVSLAGVQDQLVFSEPRALTA
jgi:anti-anti-sigma factor